MFDPAPFSPIVYYAHLLVGTLGLAGALLALCARKGTRLHKLGGRLFIVGAVVAAISALIFVATRFAPPPIVNALTALVGVITAVLALRQPAAAVRLAEYMLSVGLVCVLVWFLIVVSNALQDGNSGVIGYVGPATVIFVLVIFLVGDAYYFLNPQRRSELAVRRHMSRMLWTLAIAIRAPLFELRDDWGLPLPLVLVGPLILAGALILIFRSRAGAMRTRAA